jgi:hypothetical protein
MQSFFSVFHVLLEIHFNKAQKSQVIRVNAVTIWLALCNQRGLSAGGWPSLSLSFLNANFTCYIMFNYKVPYRLSLETLLLLGALE